MLFDNKNIVGIVLMDISKAFDCIPYVLPVAILHAYGLSKNPTTFIYSHLKPKKKGISKYIWLGCCYQMYHKDLFLVQCYLKLL